MSRPQVRAHRSPASEAPASEAPPSEAPPSEPPPPSASPPPPAPSTPPKDACAMLQANPCLPGACVSNSSAAPGYTCRCPTGYEQTTSAGAPTCRATPPPIDGCAAFSSNPCLPGACVNDSVGAAGYSCSCPPGLVQTSRNHRPSCSKASAHDHLAPMPSTPAWTCRRAASGWMVPPTPAPAPCPNHPSTAPGFQAGRPTVQMSPWPCVSPASAAPTGRRFSAACAPPASAKSTLPQATPTVHQVIQAWGSSSAVRQA
ncbi:unnamed protein product, partial [Closterium sp. NIES-54]